MALVVCHLQFGSDANSAVAATLQFPKPEHVWMSRDVDVADWSTFMNQLTSSSATPPPQAKENHDEDHDSIRRAHVITIMTEWNKGFFAPRGLKVLPLFGDDETAAGAGSDGLDETNKVSAAAGDGNSKSSRGFGFNLGKNSRFGVSLPPNSNGYGIRVGGVLLGVTTTGDEAKSDKNGK